MTMLDGKTRPVNSRCGKTKSSDGTAAGVYQRSRLKVTGFAARFEITQDTDG